MGATVATARTVAAFRNPANGEVLYVLFEQSYESNVYPHTPSWDCRAIGTFDKVMKLVFSSASACEGGMLKSKGGHIQPETYIKSWRLCFANPFQMDDLQFTLKLGGKSMYDCIPDSKVETALANLARAGRQDVADALKAGPVQVSLHRHADIIVALYGVGTGLPLWKLISGLRGLGQSDESLAPAIAKRSVAAPKATVFAIDKQNVVASIDRGPLKHLGWRYSAVGHYVTEIAYPIEMQCSFSAYKLIREFRDQCNEAPELPDSTIITVTPANAEHSYYVENAKKFAVQLGLYASQDQVPATFETTFGVVRELKEEYLLSTLEDSQVQWALAPEAEFGPPGGCVTPAGIAVQQSLF